MARDSAPETERDRMTSSPEPQNERKAQQRRLFSVIATLGVAALVIGSLSLFNSIASPFKRAPTVNSGDIEKETIAALKQSDTDADGLTDYDELFVNHTSPFVKDSDSDGKTDYDEVQAGADPNCPEGKTCGIASLTNTSQNARAAELRSALRKAGAPSYVIDQTDDETLLAAYRDIFVGTDVNGAPTQQDLNNLTASEIRKLLIANGVKADDLKNVDDNTILSIYQDALSIDTTNQ